MEKHPGIIERSIAQVIPQLSQEPKPPTLVPNSMSTKSVRYPYAFAKKLHASSILTVDELMSRYVKLTGMMTSDDSVFIELIHARNAIRKRIIAAACREDRLVEISQNLMDVEMTMFAHCRDGSEN